MLKVINVNTEKKAQVEYDEDEQAELEFRNGIKDIMENRKKKVPNLNNIVDNRVI